jgi:hypothetical protein
MRDFTIQVVLKPRERRRKIVAALPQSFPKRACESGLSSFCQKRPWVIVLTTWARLRFTKGSNDARPDRRTTSFGYCIRTQKGATGRHYDGGWYRTVQKASDVAKADCQRAMDLAHRLSSELRAAEEKAREFEADANYFRERATRAEEWLVRIHTEVQQTFFQNNDQLKHPVRERKGTP